MSTTKKISANGTETSYIIQNWMRARNTIEYLGVWEQLYNPNFKSIEFDGFRNHSKAGGVSRI